MITFFRNLIYLLLALLLANICFFGLAYLVALFIGLFKSFWLLLFVMFILSGLFFGLSKIIIYKLFDWLMEFFKPHTITQTIINALIWLVWVYVFINSIIEFYNSDLKWYYFIIVLFTLVPFSSVYESFRLASMDYKSSKH